MISAEVGVFEGMVAFWREPKNPWVLFGLDLKGLIKDH